MRMQLNWEIAALAERAPRVVLTVAIAGVGGLLFQTLGLPAPWLSGPATLVAILVVTGFRIDIPAFLRNAALMFLGSQSERWDQSHSHVAAVSALVLRFEHR